MITKLPAWVMLGGMLLSFIAGYVNAIGFISVQHQAITHLTGVISQLAIHLAVNDLPQGWHLLCVLGSFFMGCIISGALIQQSTLKLGRRYGVALLIEALLLFAAIPLLQDNNPLGDYLASLAFGVQNAMASTYSGALLRTTHLTGFVTDFGIALGHLVRGLPIDRLRFGLYGLITLSFLSGGIVGARLFLLWSFSALYGPALLLFVLGLIYLGFAHYMRASGKWPAPDAA
jgi:uncharacterized membrane protein YoaK (UPF0700 family)